ncbi:heavy metal-associated isoprenylated plant protein 9-like [Humulus lupulus]|uniref:heavy metal-associated isoprenylated plant protein 9-like n=1 Tax=Humulus lupulus TaxID=3486 RepID=UPI002B415509|nr:heavy metal-associated isoprenylated plant protein 9-like [Humulus lupulus]
MGEEAKQQEQAKEEAKPVEVVEEKKKEEKKEEPKAPSPFVLFIDLHCVGCAKKIERSIMKIRGVEAVAIDFAKNEVTIKGIVEPQAICTKIMKKTKRRAKVLSPLPAAEGEPIPEVVTSQVDGPVTVELSVNMHCEACAEQLKSKILKMRGVQTAVTELSSGKVIVKGTMDANKLVEYVYRRTKKQATIVPQPEPEPQPQPEPEPKPEPEKKEEKAAEEEKKPAEEKKPEEAAAAEEASKVEEGKNIDNNNENIGENNGEEVMMMINNGFGSVEEENMKRMIHYYQPLYVIERIPAPQLFSDENPNACCIS